jgi:hypothetical protein
LVSLIYVNVVCKGKRLGNGIESSRNGYGELVETVAVVVAVLVSTSVVVIVAVDVMVGRTTAVV